MKGNNKIKRKIYSIFCYANVTLGLLLIISMFVELFGFKIISENSIIKNIYVMFLFVGGIGCILGGIYSLGILSIAGSLPSFICMLLLLNDMLFWIAFRPDVMIFLILVLIFGLLLIIFYTENEKFSTESEKTEIKPKTKPIELKLGELRGINQNQIKKLNIIGINTLKELIEEKDNVKVKEISKLTDISQFLLKKWINQAIEYQKRLQNHQKEELKKSYWKIKKNKK